MGDIKIIFMTTYYIETYLYTYIMRANMHNLYLTRKAKNELCTVSDIKHKPQMAVALIIYAIHEEELMFKL